MKLWQHKGLKLTIDFFSKKIFQCGFLAKKTENQVDVLNLIYIYIYMLDEREGGGEEFWIFTDGHFHPIFLIRFDMLKIIVVVYNF